MARILQRYLLRYLRDLRRLSTDDLLEARYQKFRNMGVYEELLGPFLPTDPTKPVEA
jgi:acetyl-CoA carboxylase alpha subunit